MCISLPLNLGAYTIIITIIIIIITIRVGNKEKCHS